MTGQREPGGEQDRRHVGRRGGVRAADGRDQDAVRGRDDAEQAHPVGTGQARFREPDVQASAIIALELMKPVTTAFTPLAVTASRSRRVTGGFGVAISGMTTAHEARRGAPRGGIGQHCPEVGRVAAPAAVDPCGAHVYCRIVDPQDGGELAYRARGQVYVTARHGQHESRRVCGRLAGRVGGAARRPSADGPWTAGWPHDLAVRACHRRGRIPRRLGPGGRHRVQGDRSWGAGRPGNVVPPAPRPAAGKARCR